MVGMILGGIAILVLVVFVGTVGFGAPYVPSREGEAREAFRKLKPLSGRDVVVDFGCGEGVILRVAKDLGTRGAVGIEINPVLAMIAKFRNRGREGVEVRWGDMRRVRLPEGMTVAYVFGVERVMRMLLPRLEEFAREHKRDIWVMSLAFEFAGRKYEKRWGAYYLFRIKGATRRGERQ